MLKLSCVNCGAPLEIGPDLDTFACGYCGTQQQVQRKGGTVALKRVETAIKAVQRGTDRTAAELAIIRLAKEIAEAEAQRKVAIAESIQIADSARSSRRMNALGLSALVFVALVFLLFSVLEKLPKGSSWGPFLLLLNFVLPIFVGIFVFRRSKKPVSEVKNVTDLWDARVLKLKSQLASNRALLNDHPTSAYQP